MRTVTRGQFKKLILIQVLIAICLIFLPFIITPFLPSELQAYVNAKMNADLTTLETVMLLFSLPFLIWAIHNLISLYTFKPNAPKHLLYITIIGTFYYVNIFDAFVLTSIESFLNDSLYLLSGVTLALVYFSNIADEFKKPSEASVELQ